MYYLEATYKSKITDQSKKYSNTTNTSYQMNNIEPKITRNKNYDYSNNEEDLEMVHDNNDEG